MQVFRHAIDVARRENCERVMMRHLEGAIKEIFASALLPTIRGLCAQVGVVAALAMFHHRHLTSPRKWLLSSACALI